MIGQNPFTEEGRTRFRNFGRRLTGYLILSLIVGIGVGWWYFQYRTSTECLSVILRILSAGK
jgi:hypothetical protein